MLARVRWRRSVADDAPDLITGGDLVEGALSIAISYLGTKETGPNTGPDVDLFLASVGLNPGHPWCAAFLHYVFMVASARLGLVNPCPRTAGALKMWRYADPQCRTQEAARGRIFVLDTGTPGGAGHVGIVERADPDGTILSVEGNSNEAGSREGNAVVRKEWLPADGKRGKLIGFVNLAAAKLRAVP